MNIILKPALIFLTLAFLPNGAFSQETDWISSGTDTMSVLWSSSQIELEKSIGELNQLRDQIAKEKQPLAQELTVLEDELIKQRSQFESITRSVDNSNLELAGIKAENKARLDELTYIGNLLDEYARSFETKVNVSEMQYYSEKLNTAKQAAENNNLSMQEKLKKQNEFVDLSLDRIANMVGGHRFNGIGVSPDGNIEDGQYVIIGPVGLFASNTGNLSGLAIPQTGSDRPLIRPLEGEFQAGITSLVNSGKGLFPFDPSRGGALKALVQQTSLYQIFKKGGPVMWPLLCIALIATLTVLERILFIIFESRRRDPKAMEVFFSEVSKGNMENALSISMKSKFHVLHTLGYALSHKEKSLANALTYAQEQELKRFRRGIPILDTVITLAPLLGLLGTVTGMMGSFSLIGGELSAPGAITGGIAEALIATAFGLGIAITSLIPFNYLNTKMEEARIEIETAANQLELLVQPLLETTSPTTARVVHR